MQNQNSTETKSGQQAGIKNIVHPNFSSQFLVVALLWTTQLSTIIAILE